MKQEAARIAAEGEAQQTLAAAESRVVDAAVELYKAIERAKFYYYRAPEPELVKAVDALLALRRGGGGGNDTGVGQGEGRTG